MSSTYIVSKFLNSDDITSQATLGKIFDDDAISISSGYSSSKLTTLLAKKATLVNGIVDSRQLPAIRIADIQVLNTISDRNALTSVSGDVVRVLEDSSSYIYDGNNWILLADNSITIPDVFGLTDELGTKEPTISTSSAGTYYDGTKNFKQIDYQEITNRPVIGNLSGNILPLASDLTMGGQVFTSLGIGGNWYLNPTDVKTGFNKNTGVTAGTVADGLVTQNSLNGKEPTIIAPSDITKFYNGTKAFSSVDYTGLINKPLLGTASALTSGPSTGNLIPLGSLVVNYGVMVTTNTPDMKCVAQKSAFNTNFGTNLGNSVDGATYTSGLAGKSNTGHTHVASEITDFSNTVTNNSNVLSSTNHIGRIDNPHSTTKSQIGLSNVDNTSDVLKPVSSATQIILDQKAVIDDNVSVSNKTYSSSKINTLVETIISGLKFIGTWDASTNSPGLTDGSGVVGTYYIVSVNGSSILNGINEWKVGDWVIRSNGSPNRWEKLDQTNSVLTVNNQIGQVLLSTNEIGENTNLYFTDTRVNNNSSVVSNTTHRGRIDNPHNTTKSQIGLSNADNTSDLSKPISTLTQTALNGKATLSHTHPQSDIINLVSDLATKAVIDNANSTTTTTYSSSAINSLLATKKVGLRFIDNWNATTNQPPVYDNAGTVGNFYIVSVDGSTNLGGITEWKVNDWLIRSDNYQTGFGYWHKLDQTNTITSVNSLTGDVVLTKSSIGLPLVDNTSDLSKPISTLTQTALNTKEPLISTSGALASQFLNSSKTYSYPDKLWVNDSFISVVDGGVGGINMVVDNKNIVNVDATGLTLPTSSIKMGNAVYTQVNPLMTSPNTDGVIASASSEYSIGSQAWHAFDGDPILTEWHTSVTPVRYLESATDTTLSGTTILPALSTTVLANGLTYNGEWLQLQYPNPVKINVIKMFPRNQPYITRTDQSPRDFGIFVSSTGLSGTWVQVFNVLNNFWDFNTYIPKEFGFQATTAIFWRIAINRVGDGVRQNIAETICAIPNIIMSYKTNALTGFDTVQDQITLDKGLIVNGDMVVKGTNIINSIATKEPSFTKNTAFNKNFGFLTGQVPDGLLTQNALNLKQTKTADISTKKLTVTSGYDYMTGILTSNNSNGMISSSSSGIESWKAFDGNNNTVYTSDVKYKSGTGSNDPTSGNALSGSALTNSYLGEWIQIQYASALNINTFKILPNQGAGVSYKDTSPKDFAIFTSDTGVDGSWVSVFSIMNYTGWNTQFSEFSFPVAQAIYWRLAVNKIGDGNNDTRAETQLIIAAIEMWKIDDGDITAQVVNVNNTLKVVGVSNFQNDVIIGGSLTVNGFNTIINSTTVSIDDALFRLADNNSSNLSDIGIYGLSDGNRYSGLVRKSTDKKWYLFTDHLTEPLYGSNYSTNLGALSLDTINCNSILTPNDNVGLTVNTDNLKSVYPIFGKQFYVQSIVTVSPVTMPTANNTYILMKNISIFSTSGAVSKATISYNGDNGWGLRATDWVFDTRVVKLTVHINSVLSAAGQVMFSLITYTQAKTINGVTTPQSYSELGFYKIFYPSATVYVPFTFDLFIPLDIYSTYTIGCSCNTAGLSLSLQTASMIMTLV
jgi:hypothetical protein